MEGIWAILFRTVGEPVSLWEATLPFSAAGTPATYEVDGRQFLVVPSGGGKARRPEPSGGVYVAIALPD